MIQKYEKVKNILKNKNNNYVYLCDHFIFKNFNQEPLYGMNEYQHQIARTIIEDHKIIAIIKGAKQRSYGVTTFLSAYALSSLVFGNKNIALYSYSAEILWNMEPEMKNLFYKYFKISNATTWRTDKIHSPTNNKNIFYIQDGSNYPTIRDCTDYCDLTILDHCDYGLNRTNRNKNFDLLDASLFSAQNNKNSKLIVVFDEVNSSEYLKKLGGTKFHTLVLK